MSEPARKLADQVAKEAPSFEWRAGKHKGGRQLQARDFPLVY